jgi:hypothetical protein
MKMGEIMKKNENENKEGLEATAGSVTNESAGLEPAGGEGDSLPHPKPMNLRRNTSPPAPTLTPSLPSLSPSLLRASLLLPLILSWDLNPILIQIQILIHHRAVMSNAAERAR